MKAARSSPAPARLRCAIYTRKSSEEGLDQDFNSLHAQRDACEAYVLSQVGEGWGALPNAYDDGGFSGGNMDRPGLKQLLADVDAGRVDVVVVYKVDRLTRSLADFAKIVERFDAKGVSFVSVTQAFNTTTSMGRLTLNVLLSFAQFEREVTGERIRDKIAASKAKGMWMGGNLPLGYEADGRTLKINEAEAQTVRRIFRRYLEIKSVHALRDELERDGIVSKLIVGKSGETRGGRPFGRGALFHLLSNRLYLGQITHKGTAYPGLHPAIIDTDTFEAVAGLLARNAGPKRRSEAGLQPRAPSSPLAGIIFDDRGGAMTPVSARKGQGRLYRYYVSAALAQGRRQDAGSFPRVPAPLIETFLVDHIGRLAPAPLAGPADLPRAVKRVEVGRRKLAVSLREEALSGEGRDGLPGDATLEEGPDGPVLTLPGLVTRRGGSTVAVGPSGAAARETPQVDLVLLKALVRAESWKRDLLSGEAPTIEVIAGRERITPAYVREQLRLAFLSPVQKRAILDGRSAHLSLQRLADGGVPLSWAEQDAACGGR